MARQTNLAEAIRRLRSSRPRGRRGCIYRKGCWGGGWAKLCIVGCEDLAIDYMHKTVVAGNKVIREGDEITINGSTGEVFQRVMNLIKPELPDAYYTLMKWAEEIRKLNVRTNVDTPYDAENAIR